MNRSNGGYIGILKEDASVYPFSGVYPLYEQQENKLAGLWPDRADSNFANTSLLLKTSNQSIRSTTAIDSSVNNLTVSRVGTPSTAWTSPYQTSGYWSNYFNGTTDYLSNASSSAFTFGTADFTVEYWVYCPSVPGLSFVCGGPGASSTDIAFGFLATGVPYCSSSANWPVYTNTVMTANVWTHIAFTRASGTWKLWMNGVDVTAGSQSNPNVTTAQFGIGSAGAAGGGKFTGYVSNLRVIKGTAIYTSAFTPSTSPLTAITNTSLLICQNNRFIDNSTNNFAVTLTGTPQTTPYWYPSTFSAPAASVGGGYFNGTTDWIQTPNTSTFDLSSSSVNFTIEAWVYNAKFGSSVGIIGARANASTTGWGLSTDASGIPYLNGVIVGNAYANRQLNTNAILGNTWTHIALVKDATGYTCYINGIGGTKIALTGGLDYQSAQPITIGAVGSTGEFPFGGYISNFRIVKGTAVYTGNFTPPTDFLTTTGGTYPSTSNVVTSIASSNTSLLLNLADSNYTSFANTSNNNAFIDSGPYAFPVTRLGTPTQGSITPYWPDGYWSNYFDGSSYLTTPYVSGFDVGTGDLTLECWVYLTSVSGILGILSNHPSVSGGGFGMYTNNGVLNSQLFTNGNTSPDGIGNGTLTINTWYHVAMTRSSGTMYLWINGVSQGSTASSRNPNNSSGFYIGSYEGASYKNVGYISNIRFVKGQALATGNFTPPTSPVTSTTVGWTGANAASSLTGTVQLLTNQSNRFKDNSINNLSMTVSGGTPKVQAFQPFSPKASYNTAAYGGSGYFPLSQSDYLQFPVSSAFAPGTGDFTLECWVYATSGTDNYIWTQSVSGTNYFLLGFNATTAYFYMTASGGGTPINGPTTSLPLNAWHHVAVTRSSGTVRVFVNGVSGTPTSNTTDLSNLSYVPTIGRYSHTASFGIWTGYISNLRYIKGVSVYTGNFTPPSLGLLTNSGSTSAVAYPNTANVNTVFGSSSTSLLQNFSNSGIYDATIQNNLITVSNAQASNTVVKWAGSTSMRFNGSSDYLTIPTNSALNLGTGSFTVEAWVYLNATSSDYFVISASGSGGAFFGFTSSTNIGYGRTAVAWDYNIASGIIPKVWYHLAWCRSGTSMRIFVNGTQVGTTQTTSQAYDLSTTSTNVGSQGANYYLNGYIQDLRVTNAIARYTANFTPPVLPFLTL